jgi:hypothetical protein
MLCFLPARDFELSQRFYIELGFERVWAEGKLARFQIGRQPAAARKHAIECRVQTHRAADGGRGFAGHQRSVDAQACAGLGGQPRQRGGKRAGGQVEAADLCAVGVRGRDGDGRGAGEADGEREGAQGGAV